MRTFLLLCVLLLTSCMMRIGIDDVSGTKATNDAKIPKSVPIQEQVATEAEQVKV